MNQQDTILPFCKSVKFLYSGVKKLYSDSKLDLRQEVIYIFYKNVIF